MFPLYFSFKRTSFFNIIAYYKTRIKELEAVNEDLIWERELIADDVRKGLRIRYDE